MSELSAKVTPTRKSGFETKRKIMDAAFRFMETKGLMSMTTNHIARDAGVNVASLYRFFENKEAIIVAIMEEYFADIESRLEHYFLNGRETNPMWENSNAYLDESATRHYDNPSYRYNIMLAIQTIPAMKEHSANHQRRCIDILTRSAVTRYSNSAEEMDVIFQYVFLTAVSTLSHATNLPEPIKTEMHTLMKSTIKHVFQTRLTERT
ncbi:hypothetical protein GCM10017044_11840 [Kordiimonas sediminis]|uniref:HTH tetR-type domain-containing protein n=1 Tax=Kordiimonas sediminis TaxID=1735581 RepID=A0A919AQ20_9PROT|nr:TetR/AcrR family transcriptional regulator [Kordiimonas sediminis]GHF18925.1 hypothetical protein GCM10017044_11840 [Kordiimonas sediminis]